MTPIYNYIATACFTAEARTVPPPQTYRGMLRLGELAYDVVITAETPFVLGKSAFVRVESRGPLPQRIDLSIIEGCMRVGFLRVHR